MTLSETIPTVNLMGLLFQDLSEQETAETILRALKNGQGGWLVNPNTDVLRQCFNHQDIRELVSQADLVIADGMPLVWCSRLQKTPLRERVAGATFISTLSEHAERLTVPVLLLGGAEGAAERAAAILQRHYPDLSVRAHCPPFGFENNPAEGEAIRQAVDASNPSIVFCAFGFPKQERLMSFLHEQFPRHWFIGSGASVDMLAGNFRRAPLWMQQSGLEWLYRLLQEPKRLFRRYIIDDVPFFARMLIASLRAR